MASPISLTPVRNLSSSLLNSPTYLSVSVVNYALSLVQGRASPPKRAEDNECLDLDADAECQKVADDESAVVTYEKAILPTEYGVQRKLAKHGHHIMSLSIKEMDEEAIQQDWATAPSNSPKPIDPRSNISRQLYVHALTYLLRALPSDLTLSEILDIGSQIPDCVIDEECRRRTSLDQNRSGQDHAPGQAADSKLEEAVIAAIRMLATSLRLSTPVVISMLRKMAEKERKYKISERTLALSCSVIDRLSRSPLGNAVLNNGVTLLGAIGKGLNEGLVILTEPIQEGRRMDGGDMKDNVVIG